MKSNVKSKYKNFLLVMVLLLAGTVGNAYTPKGDFQIDGKFLSQKNVKVEVFSIPEKGKLINFIKKSKRSRFSVRLLVETVYLIKFTSRNTKVVKYLLVNACCSGTFTVDVDFRNEDCAYLEYNKNEGTLTGIDPIKLLTTL